MFNFIKAFLFDIGSTLVLGPNISPNKQISTILFGDHQESNSIADIIMRNDFSSPKQVIDHLKQTYQISLQQGQKIEMLWKEQESAAKEIGGATQTLTILKERGYKLGIVSDIWKPYYLSFCKACPDILDMIDCQILSFREGSKKPSYELLLRAINELRTRPEETIVVGDTYYNDIKPAIELNFKTIWYLSRPEREAEALREVIMGELSKPDKVITDIKQLLELDSLGGTLGMKILKIEKHPEDELLQRMRRVTLLNQPNELIYKDVYISLEMMSIDELSPAQYYILSSELEKIRHLKLELMQHGVNLYKLDGYITLWLEGNNNPIDLLPAVVEESIEANGKTVNIINDGMHRIFVARLEWVIPQVVFVRGIPKDKPYYAYPIPDGWRSVKAVDELPREFLKKWHRIENYKTLYRDFNSAFNNVGGPRGRFIKDK